MTTRLRFTASLLCLAIALASHRAFAQTSQSHPDLLDMSLEDLMKVEIDSVYGASGYKQDITRTPASITIITGDEIKRYGYRTLADVLRNVPGIYVTSDRVFNYIGIRGFGPPGDYNSRILLQIDGHRMDDPVSGASGYGTDFPVDIDLIDRIEFIRGPNSSVYIAGALLGVVNVVTKHGREVRGLSVSGELASFGTYKTRLTYGGRLKNGLEYLFSGSYFTSHGPSQLYFPAFDSPATNHGVAANAAGSVTSQEFVKLSYRGFTLEGAYSSSRQNDPTAPYGSIFNDTEQRVRVAPSYLDLSYEHNLGGDWGYAARLYYDNTRYRAIYPLDESAAGGAPHVLNEDLSSGRDAGASFMVSKRLPNSQTLIAGMEYRNDFEQNQWNQDSDPYALYFASRQRSSLWGGHVQDEIQIRKDLIVDVGLSYDHYSTFGSTGSPRAALIYQPLEATTFKFLYGGSFRAPTAFELYYAVPGEEANPHLKPETARTMEVVFEQALAKGLHIVASGYYYPVRALISATTDPESGNIVYRNHGRVDLTGSEITLKRQSRSGLEVGISVSLERATDGETTGALPNSPRVLSQANVSIPFFHRKMFASVDAQYVSRRTTLAGGTAESYFVPNLTLYSPRALTGWELSASVYNATNEIYGDPASLGHLQDMLYQNGRNFRLKFTRRF
ncbi:MAG: TonB-dependent receptor [Bryobacteraceae bacterium]